jgi:hypothetical protein
MKLGQFITTCLSLLAFFTPQKSEGQTISGVINNYYKATAIIDHGTYNTSSYSGITLQSIAGLSTGDRVLIIQMKGATIASGDNSSFGNISSIGNAGKYEFSSICGFLDNTIVLSNHLLHTYDVSGVQVVRVPVYENATVSGALLATPWNASTGLGGIIALEVNGTLTLNAGINANGLGFMGGNLIQFANCFDYFGVATGYSYDLTETQSNYTNGAYKGEGLNNVNDGYEGGKGKQSNGGGGGNNHNTGGGGGANYGAGGRGGIQTGQSCNGANYGIGGESSSSFGYSVGTNKIFFGGGGGSGHANNPEGTPGGNGGGIIYIKANQLIGNSNSISANGSQGINSSLAPNPTNASRGDGAGGGGAGGTILLDIASYSGTLTVEARGANGNNSGFQAQCPGPGGGGGGGVIWYTGATPATTNVSGGNAGTITSTTASCNGTSNGGTAGSAGLVQSGFAAPQGTNTINCSILPLDLLKQFAGKRSNQSIQLNWILTNTDNVQKVVLERKTGNDQFRKIAEQLNPFSLNGFYTDGESSTNVTYRLVVYALNGEWQYSNHVYFNYVVTKTFNFYPNPANENVTIQLPENFNGKTGIIVTDVNGRQVINQQQFIQSSQNTTVVSVKRLPAGMYSIRLENKGETYSAKLLKQ